MGRLMNSLFIKSAIFHFQTHWSSRAHFWSGVLGMLVNNALTLLGIWAMLFAGKPDLDPARDVFLITNFLLMIGWGVVHVFLGGVTNLDQQINEGGLDLALVTPRAPFLLLSYSKSHLPAWGDVILGLIGIVIYSFYYGPFFFAHSILATAVSTLSLYAFFLFIGCLAFWFRRTESANSVLLNICLAFNTYPVIDTASGLRWILFLSPILLAGVIPARAITNPSLELLGLEIVGGIILFILVRAFFYLGLKRYQSNSGMSGQR